MKGKAAIWAIAFLAFLLSGCASVNFYEVTKNGMKNAGFLYYPPKPYLLVEKGEKQVTTKLISLPDLSRPHRVKQSNGLGSVELGFETNNGMIKSFNSKTDSKTAETIASVATLGTAKAAIDTASAALIAAELKPVQEPQSAFLPTTPKYEIVPFSTSISLLETDVIQPLKSSANPALFQDEVSRLENSLDLLNSRLYIEYSASQPDTLIRKLEERRKLASTISTNLKSVLSALNIYASNPKAFPDDFSSAKFASTPLGKVVKILTTFSSRSDSIVGLYEIDYVGKELRLRKIVLD